MAKNNVLNMLRMDTREHREATARVCFDNAKSHKGPITKKFIELDEYYHNDHYTNEQITEIAAEKGWDFVPPALTDPFVQVETQIDPLRPEFTFKGRDDDMDSTKAKTRQAVVEFILYNNRFDELMPENERHLKKLGTAFWKVSFDGSVTGPGYVGEIIIGGPDPANLYPDRSAYCLDDCEYFDYPYRIHKNKAWRTFNKPAQRAILQELSGSSSHGDTEIYTRSQSFGVDDDTWQAVEHWYRDEDGDIACSIQIENKEVLWIKKYWKNTRHSGNKMYPFICYYDIPDSKSFWGLGEIETIKDLVDAADREFLMALLKDMYDADDMLIVEETALKDGTSIVKSPGAITYVKDQRAGGIKRLGGMSSNTNALNMINKIEEKIQQTNGSFDSSQGKEPIRVTTSSGIAQLNERAGKRSDNKKADRSAGFRRLYELLDWTALEFYNQDRIMIIRGKKEGENDSAFTFNSDSIKSFNKQKFLANVDELMNQGVEVTPEMEQELADESTYYPRIDTEIVTSDGLKQSKAFGIQAASEVAGQLDNINPAKAEILKSNVELMGIPNEQDIKDAIDETLNQQQQAQQPQDQGTHPVDQYYNSLSPEQQQQFAQLSKQEQIALVEQGMGGNG